MTSTTDSRRHPPRVLLFPSCDRDGRLLAAITRRDGDASVRADALLFGWMLGLDAAIDAVSAARAVLSVAAQQPSSTASVQRRALVDGLERFVADRGRIASLSSASPSSRNVRPRRRWRERRDDDTSGIDPFGRSTNREDDTDEQRKTRR